MRGDFAVDILIELKADHGAIRAIVAELRSESTAPDLQVGKLHKLGTWLSAHTTGEARTIDASAERLGRELRAMSFEDSDEHGRITRLHAKILRTTNAPLKKARLGLLCDLITQHLDEEEQEYFPHLERTLSAQEREKLGARYREITRQVDRLRPEVAGNVLGWITGRPDPRALETNLR
jgi:hypothetical protein